MDFREVTVKIDGGGNGAKVAIGAASAQSAALSLKPTPTSTADARSDVLVHVSVDCFVRNGANPTAVVDTDLLLIGGNTYRISGVKDGEKLAFITSGGAGFAWIYPGA